MDVSVSKFQEIVRGRKTWGAAVHAISESDMTEQLNNKNGPNSFLPQKALNPI